jgi:hypothetical protein
VDDARILKLVKKTFQPNLYIHGKIIIIPWDYLEDFVEGE